MNIIYFIGFMGAGKTTIGKQLASEHNINFIDIDKEIELTTNNSVLGIFQKYGEHHFREIETKTLINIPKNNIVSCGGGLPVYNNNMEFIKKNGMSIYLKASEEEIFMRLSKQNRERPLIQNKSEKALRTFIKQTLLKREIFYSMADYTIETTNTSSNNVLRKINTLPLPF